MKSKNHIYQIIAAVACMIICSRLVFHIPITETGIPITGQSLAISLVIYFLKPRFAAFAILLYLLLGVVGLPVFAEGKSGIDVIIGKTGGYLYGFLIAAILMGRFHEHLKKKFLDRLLYFGLVTIYILLFGMLHLAVFIGFEKAFAYGVLPFIPGGLVKVLLALLITYLVDQLSKAW